MPQGRAAASTVGAPGIFSAYGNDRDPEGTRFGPAGGAVAYHGRTVAKRIGELLVEAGVLSQSQLEQALFAQRKDGRKLGQLLIELGLVSEVQLTQTLSRQLSVPWVSLYHVDFSRSLLNLVSREIAERYAVVPDPGAAGAKTGRETLYVAMDDPTNEAAIEEDLARTAALPVKPMIACPSDIRAAIQRVLLRRNRRGRAGPRRPTLATSQAPLPRPMLDEPIPVKPVLESARFAPWGHAHAASRAKPRSRRGQRARLRRPRR